MGSIEKSNLRNFFSNISEIQKKKKGGKKSLPELMYSTVGITETSLIQDPAGGWKPDYILQATSMVIGSGE